MMKKKIIATFIILGIGILIFFMFGRRLKLINLSEEQIKEVYIEVLAENEMSVEKVSVVEEDVVVIKEVLLEEEIYSDGGFVFAEGGYRIVMDTGEDLINFYPYCGNVWKFKVGEEGNYYITLDEDETEKEEVLQNILYKYLYKYNNGIEGIRDWSYVNGMKWYE